MRSLRRPQTHPGRHHLRSDCFCRDAAGLGEDDHAEQRRHIESPLKHEDLRSNDGQRRDPDAACHRERQQTIHGFHAGQRGTNVFLTGLNILGGRVGISNSGALTVSDCTISGNSSHNPGGGIVNHGPLTVTNCTISGNAATGGNNIVGPGGGIFTESTSVVVTGSTISGNIGGGIVNSFEGQVAVTGSTISGNSDYGIDNSYGSQVALTDSTVTGNSGYGIQVDNNSVLTVTNSIVAGNTASGSMDCSGSGCPTNGANGNLVGVAPLLAPLGNYGGPTPTMPPLPGSPAICAGLIADISPGVTTDQRGFPRTTTYGSNPPCVDSGSVQTDYSLRFSTEPPAIVALDVAFASAVQLNESGSPFPVSGINIPLALGKGRRAHLPATPRRPIAQGLPITHPC